tara:strand:+ start:2037 stop:2540 length:504 start_codon:yes stop_codon:yes gene_type:complete
MITIDINKAKAVVDAQTSISGSSIDQLRDKYAEMAGAASAEPAVAEHLKSAVCATTWSKIKDKRSIVQAGGVLIAGKWFHTDPTSRIQYLGLFAIDGSLPIGIMWKTLDGSRIEITESIANQIIAKILVLDNSAFSVAQSHRIAMEASLDPATYDFSTGWPDTYTPA